MADATLTFGVKGPTMDFTTSVTVSQANTQRILGYLTKGSAYSELTLEDGTTREATPEEAAQAFALGILKSLLVQTVRFEQEEAARIAKESVADIETT